MQGLQPGPADVGSWCVWTGLQGHASAPCSSISRKLGCMPGEKYGMWEGCGCMTVASRLAHCPLLLPPTVGGVCFLVANQVANSNAGLIGPFF